MKTKVSLKEMVGTKIIYAVLLVFYYWMWARRDWHDYYDTVQLVMSVFACIFFAIQADRTRRYSREEKDELAIQNLRRADSVGLKLMMVANVVIAFALAFAIIDGRKAGYALVALILALTVVRFILFCVMDSKGI